MRCLRVGASNDAAAPYVEALAEIPEVLLVDVSGDHRFDANWHYGLPELYRSRREGKRKIANPGCYATAMQLAIAPFLEGVAGPIACFGISGYSGAGARPSPKNDPERLEANILPYRPVGHLHEREVSFRAEAQIHFMPHVAPFFRGISVTANLPLRRPHTLAEVRARLQVFYREETLVRVSDEIPELADNVGGVHACVGGAELSEDGRRLVVFSTLDNLLKGAASQALQNINSACGFDEREGLNV